MGSFRPNRRGIAAVPRLPSQRAWALKAAQDVATEAKRTAPVRTGSYRRSIKPTVVMLREGWTGRVNAFDFKALWVELGTNGIRKSRVLGGALDAVGTSVKVGRR